MAIKGLSPTSFKKYVLKDDPNRGPNGEALPGATVFHLKTLNGYERAVVRDEAVKFETVKNEKGEDTIKIEDKPGLFKPAYQTLRVALQGWDNFTDQDGNQIPFETELLSLADGMPAIKAPTWDCLVRLPSPQAFELMWEIMGFNELTKAESSKSGAASLPVKSIPNGSAAPATPIADPNGAVEPDSSPTTAIQNDAEKYPLVDPELRRVPRHDRGMWDDPGVRRTPMGNGGSGSTQPTLHSSGKDS